MSFNFTVTPRNEILLITTARSLLKSNSGDKEKCACVDLAEKFCGALMKIMKIDKNRGVCRACSSLSLSTFTFRDGGGGLFQHIHTERQCTPARLSDLHTCMCTRPAQTTPDSPLVPVHPWRGDTGWRRRQTTLALAPMQIFAASFDFLIARARISDYKNVYIYAKIYFHAEIETQAPAPLSLATKD